MNYRISDPKTKFYGWVSLDSQGETSEYKYRRPGSIPSLGGTKPFSLNLIEGDAKLTIIMPFENKEVTYKDRKIQVAGLPEQRIGCRVEILGAEIDELRTKKEDLFEEMNYSKRSQVYLKEDPNGRVELSMITTLDGSIKLEFVE
jgi:hypothetical protein